MGLDLAVYVDRYWGEMNDYFLGTDRLAFHRNYDLFDLIQELDSKPITEKGIKFRNYADDGIRDENTDPCGTPLNYVLSGQFSRIDSCSNTWNNAILTFLKSLPPDTTVILYWN